MVSMSVTGAGLTSVMSCDAAEVMSDPADWIAGCMRGASDSRPNVESGEGKEKELAETTASICSTDDCMMLTRAFNSAKVSGSVLPKTTLSKSSTPTARVRLTLRQHSGKWMLEAVMTRRWDPKRGET